MVPEFIDAVESGVFCIGRKKIVIFRTTSAVITDRAANIRKILSRYALIPKTLSILKRYGTYMRTFLQNVWLAKGTALGRFDAHRKHICAVTGTIRPTVKRGKVMHMKPTFPRVALNWVRKMSDAGLK